MQTDRQPDTPTDRQTDRQHDRQTKNMINLSQRNGRPALSDIENETKKLQSFYFHFYLV